MNNLKVQGFFLIDVDSAALNNAGKNTNSNVDNSIATKSIYKNRRRYAYAAGQAIGNWWRKTLQSDFGWELSPLLVDEKVVFATGDPLLYPDDDIFGYMKAAKDKMVDQETGEVQKDSKGKDKTENVTVTRKAPLNKSVIVSVGPVSIARNFSVMARHEGNPAPYMKEEYSAIMKNQFSIDTFWVGRFSSYNRTGYKNITEKQRDEYLQKGCHEIDDPYVKNSKGLPQRLVSLPKELRFKRITDPIKALPILSGGAMQTNNMADVTPKFLILSATTSGSHPFGTVMSEYSVDNSDDLAISKVQEEESEEISISKEPPLDTYRVKLNIEAIKEYLKDYKKQFIGTVFIAKRSGFLDNYTDELKALENLGNDYPPVKIGTIGEITELFCHQLEKYID